MTSDWSTALLIFQLDAILQHCHGQIDGLEEHECSMNDDIRGILSVRKVSKSSLQD